MTLKQIFIANLKKKRKEQGISQIKLSEMCNTTSNYIGQIEMGRRIPSLEKIAAALGIPSYELFTYGTEEKEGEKEAKTKEYLMKMPSNVKKMIISNLLAEVKRNITSILDQKNC